MYFAHHSQAFDKAEILDQRRVAPDMITHGLLKRLVVDQKLRGWMLPLPLGMVTYLSRNLPAVHQMWVLVGAMCLAQALEFFMAARIDTSDDAGPRSRVTWTLWQASIVLTGAVWGALLWPVIPHLQSGIDALFAAITLLVTISIGALMMAHMRRALYAYLIGVNLTLVPLAILMMSSLGALPIVSICLLMLSLVVVSSMATEQARKGLVAELENAQMAAHLKEALNAAEYLSQRDSLTGLLNRRAFEEASAAIRAAQAEPTTLILLDLDHFKRINDGFGHAVGDQVLRSTARLISNFARPEALGSTLSEAIARWGGEEFIIALGNCDLAAAPVAAEQLRARLAEYREIHWPEAMVVTGSFGVTQWQPGELLHEAIGRADKAMYQAKVAGRNLVMSIAHDAAAEIDSRNRRFRIAARLQQEGCMESDIRAATSADLSRVVETLAAAFAEDPLVTWFVRDGAARADALRALFHFMVIEENPEGIWLDVARDGGAVAMWMAPGRARSADGLFNQLALLPRFLRISGAGRIIRALLVGQMLDKIHPHTPHAYLQFLACHPDMQGQGLGSALLRHRLALIDAAHIPAFLETAGPQNLPLYLRHGFVLQGEVRPSANGPLTWPMWRAAADAPPQ